VAVAGAVLRDSYASSHRWYEECGEVLSGQRASLDQPPEHDETLHGVLRRAFEEARADRRGDQLRTMLQMLWADELLETQRQVQADLAGSVELFTRSRRKPLTRGSFFGGLPGAGSGPSGRTPRTSGEDDHSFPAGG
jgi:hypothetical protein